MAVTETASDGAASAPGRRSRWVTALRLGVSVVLLALVIPHLRDFDQILPKRHHLSTPIFLLAGIAVTFVGVVLSAWRWQRVLTIFDAHVPVRKLLGHYLAGLFVGNALPGTIGGDVLRVSRATTTTGSSTTAFASVVLERLTGFVALPLLASIGFVLQPSLLDLDRAWIALAISGGSLVALCAILFVAGHPRIAGRFAEHENWMRFVGAVHLGVNDLRRRPRDIASVLGAALLYQASVVLAVLLVVHALDVSLPVAAVIAFVPAVAMAQVIPISVSGLGVREGLLVIFLSPLHVAAGKAVAIGLLWYGMTLVVSVVGAPSFAIGQRRRAPAGS